MIGTTVGGYEITEFLAEGGMGTVWAAKHAVMERDAVVKLLRPELGQNAEIVARFINEARAAASINDPGIVQVFDVGNLEDGRSYIVMERLGGHTLSARLHQRVVERPTRTRALETVSVLRLIARTLVAAHGRGIIHRDLKPDNIFLVPDPDVAGGERTKIVDFGIAKLATGMAANTTRAGSMFGTPSYMAPEQCSDAGSVDARADLYAVGCIGYEMLTGKPPFTGSGFEVIASQLRDDPVPLRERDPAIPAELAAVIERLLRKEAAERFASAAELYETLDKLVLSKDDLHTPLPFARPPDLVATNPARPSAKVDATAPTMASIPPVAAPSTGPSVAPSVAPSPAHTTLGGAAGSSHTSVAAGDTPQRSWRMTGAVLLVAVAAAVTLIVARTGGGPSTKTVAAADPAPPVAVSASAGSAAPVAVPAAPDPVPAASTDATGTAATLVVTSPTPSGHPAPRTAPTTPTPRTTPGPTTPTSPTRTPVPPPTTPERVPTPAPPSPVAPSPAPATPDPAPVQQLGTPTEATPASPTVQPLGTQRESVPVEPAPTLAAPRVLSVNAGPIWSNNDAKLKCPALCKAPRRWNGVWRTVEKAKQSTCDCELP